MKTSMALLIAAMFIFVVDWVSFSLGYPLSYSGNFLFLVYVAFFLAIISVYLKLNELEQKKAQ